MPPELDLTGTWLAHEGDDELRRSFAEDAFDDTGWEPVVVPGHWRSSPAFAESDGPVLHRRRFEASSPGEERRSWLRFEGLFYQGDVWLDGSYLGDTEGYFAPHTFEVTDQLAERSEHLLAVELACAPQPDRTAKRNLTGAFQHGDWIDPSWNPGGIWRPVGLRTTGPVAIAALRVRCRAATAARATLALTATLDAAHATDVELRTTVDPSGVEHRRTHRVTGGTNRVAWTVEVDRPPLWWPWALGAQPLVDVAVEVTPVDGRLSDRAERRTGLRQVRMRRWVLEVNGERLFCKGTNLGPTRAALAEAAPEELAGDVRLAREAGLDLVRVNAHISRPELYTEADDAGVLVWQDLPLQWGYARGLRGQATRQSTAAVDLLAHHPSIAVWCGHSEPLPLDAGDPRPAPSRRFVRATLLPSWNKTVLDTVVARALDKADGTRPIVAHSGVLPHPAWGTSSHLSFGWHHGDERDFPGWVRRLPVLARWVAEFGAQAVPATDGFLRPERWPALDWDHLERHHGMHREAFERRVPPQDHATFESWRAATQAYQAEVIRHHVEYLRRCKYRPAGGFCQLGLVDSQPAVSWSVLDHERVPKAGFDALRRACAPVIVTADRPAAAYAPGESVALDVHLVSDLRYRLARSRVSAHLRWSGGEASWGWEGEVGADAVEYVGTISWVVPDAPGPVQLRLVAEWPGGRVENGYTSCVAALHRPRA